MSNIPKKKKTCYMLPFEKYSLSVEIVGRDLLQTLNFKFRWVLLGFVSSDHLLK